MGSVSGGGSEKLALLNKIEEQKKRIDDLYEEVEQIVSTAITTGNIGQQSVNYASSAGTANSVNWNNIVGKPDSFSPSSHDHDDRYYRKEEIQPVPFARKIDPNLIPTEVNVECSYQNDALKNLNAVILCFYSVSMTILLTPHTAAVSNLAVKQDNQYWGGEIIARYDRNSGTVYFKVNWKGSSQILSNFRLTNIIY